MDLLISFSVLAGFLILGMILRAKIKFLQSLFLPASVIGGFIGLLLGPIVLGDYAIIPIPEDWISIYALLPGILIVPVVASIPFGVKFKSRLEKRKERQERAEKPASVNLEAEKGSSTTRNTLVLLAILVIISQGQLLLGLLLSFIFEATDFVQDLYATFGTEIGMGFSGGHGTAGVVGSLLQSMNQPYWELAQGVTVTTATVGIIGGILIGIVLINIAARKGYTKFLSGPQSFPEEMLKGYESNIEKQNSFGKETTTSSSIDSLTFHLALILGGSGLAYALLSVIQYFQVPIIGSVPIWAYAIIVMYGIWWIMCQLNLSWVVNNQITSKIASMFTDFAVVAAIVSLPVQAVLTYIVPILIMVTVIMAFTVSLAYWMSKKLYGEFWFERSVAILGTNSGVFITGLLLLKMVDPDYKSPVLGEFSVSYSINSVLGFILFPVLFGVLVNEGILMGLSIPVLAIIGAIIFMFIVKGKPQRPKFKEMKA
ncbi:hypothetical protein [Lacicoccus alkaliphilus]|uniref:Glutamate:Na+ symporter, ESS family n=2 Tax=Lacicoccus TaxID=3076172 RepID=A0A1M7GMC1_9BACL|nr:hypothetical protein [Salinicoccus alkaliphilus]SHM17029.1 glutamate:Na+ symporter, ESS family [Salinicoccus alkaliphilus DSM 16010]